MALYFCRSFDAGLIRYVTNLDKSVLMFFGAWCDKEINESDIMTGSIIPFIGTYSRSEDRSGPGRLYKPPLSPLFSAGGIIYPSSQRKMLYKMIKLIYKFKDAS